MNRQHQLLKENKTIRLLKSIGSPFVMERAFGEDRECDELFNYAFKNRIGLLYLDRLEKRGRIENLRKQYDKLLHRHKETLVTVANLAKVFNNGGVDYVIMKTIRPYLNTPNDVDVLFMGEKKNYPQALSVLKDANYKYLKAAPRQIGFYDPRATEVRSDKRGGIYHIDLYMELAADYVVYLDKKKLRSHQQEITVLDENKVSVLTLEAELAVTLMHGVFPARSYQLQDFYTTLYLLDQMDKEQINNFVDIVINGHIKRAIKAGLSVTARLHEVAFGFIPEKIMHALVSISAKTDESALIEKNDFNTPYTYSFLTFFKVFWERASDGRGFASFFVQGFYMMNPVFLKSVIEAVVSRQKGTSYEQL